MKEADRLGLSDPVAWYLKSREIPFPKYPPTIRTPDAEAAPGSRFSAERVDRVLRGFSLLRHTQGEWSGKPLNPDPWQIAYVLAPTYGWVRRRRGGDEDAYDRIVRTQYVEVPRKNGKTTLAGGQATYLVAADGEPGAQVFAVAGSKDQARFCFDPVRNLAEKSPALEPFVKVTRSRIVHEASESFFAVVSNVADLLHGANVHGAVIDELHVHKTRGLVEAVETGTGARRQPLVCIITTADENRSATVYAEKRDYLEALASGVISDPTFYGVVWCADEADDPFDPETWKKANPGFGVSPSEGFLESAAAKASQSPANLASFRRLHLGVRTGADSRFFDLPTWDANASIVNEDELVGTEVFGGLDLASTGDLTALAWVAPDGDGGFDCMVRHWLPEAALGALDARTAGHASGWVESGVLALTPGNVCDYDFIREQVRRDAAKFSVREIAFDPWNASQLVNDLTADGAPMVTVRQGFGSMSAPTKELLRLLLEGVDKGPRLRHGGNPLLRWEASHFAVATDPAGNHKPSKQHASDKIDGIVALVMALDRATRSAPAVVSAYEDRGVEVL